MELRQLRNFVHVAELKSFSRAAESIRIAQPALSRQIRKLEEHVGVQLLYRNGRGAVLTEAGEKFYQQVKGMLRQLDHACGSLSKCKKDVDGEVVLGVPPQLGAVLVTDLIRKFRSRHPNARIRISEGFSYQIVDWLKFGRVDLGFVYEPQFHRQLIAQLSINEDVYLIGSPGDAITSQKTCRFTELAALELIVPDRPSSLRNSVEASAARAGVTVSFRLEVDSLPAIKELVREGEGYALLPYAAVYDEIQRGLLTASRIVEPSVWRALALATTNLGVASMASRALIHLIRDEIAGLLAVGAWSGCIADRRLRRNEEGLSEP